MACDRASAADADEIVVYSTSKPRRSAKDHAGNAAGAAVMIIVHAYMEVTDSSREDFYCQGLGLTLKRRMSPTWIELAGANLSVLTSATGPEFISISSSAILMQSYPD